MFMSNSRRDFIKLSAFGFGTAFLATGISACDDALSDNVSFTHGVASGDPLTDRVILWTRAVPADGKSRVRIGWEMAVDEKFLGVINSGTIETSAERDFTVKIDAAGLLVGTSYYFRFKAKKQTSPVGKTRTLPSQDVSQIKFAVVSCSNYPTGRFHVYREIAKRNDLDAVIHLGDYIYEYARGGYASDQAKELGREVLPDSELLNLQDYRSRYAQYRTDLDLQAVHASHPFIAVWDDHEIANDSWKEGAENHQPEEGDFNLRKLAALQAYSEWLPIRPKATEEGIYRSFTFGQIVALHMLDTRIIGRDKQLEIGDYFGANGFDAQQFQTDLNNPERSILGVEQLNWLTNQLENNQATWQVLGQQVLMGRMYLPGALATQQISLAGFARLVRVATLAGQGQTLSPDDLQFLATNQKLLQIPSLPYNLDAWDSYEAERERVLNAAHAAGCNLVVLAGDSHNAWANDLVNREGVACGVEFATSSVTSPGLELYLGLSPESVAPTEAQLTQLIGNLKYTNLSDRGYMTVTFTQTESTAEFLFVDSILKPDYQILAARSKTMRVKAGENALKD